MGLLLSALITKPVCTAVAAFRNLGHELDKAEVRNLGYMYL